MSHVRMTCSLRGLQGAISPRPLFVSRLLSQIFVLDIHRLNSHCVCRYLVGMSVSWKDF